MPWFAAVGAEACVEATTTFRLVEGCTRAAGGVDVHGGGGLVGERFSGGEVGEECLELKGKAGSWRG